MTLPSAPGGAVQDVEWFVIRSSHALRLVARGGRPIALCGKTGHSPLTPILDHLPAGKSCETCLRIVARRADA